MRHVGVREFKDQATAMMSSGETFVIEKHGRPIGFFIPIRSIDRQKQKESLDHLAEVVEQVLAETGMTEDELIAEMSRPSDS